MAPTVFISELALLKGIPACHNIKTTLIEDNLIKKIGNKFAKKTKLKHFIIVNIFVAMNCLAYSNTHLKYKPWSTANILCLKGSHFC